MTTDATSPQTPSAPGPAPEEIADLRDFLVENGRSLLLSVSLVVLIGVSVFLYRQHTRTRAETAAMLFGSARTVQDLTVLIEQYPSSPQAPLAMLRLAKTYFDAGNHNMALNTYTDFGKRFPNHLLISIAEVGRAHSMEAVGLTQEALNLFSDFLSRNPKHYLAPQAALGKARCLDQLGRTTDARVVYEDFLTAHPTSPWTPKVREQLAQLKKRGDAPVPTPTVPISLTNIVSGAALVPRQ